MEDTVANRCVYSFCRGWAEEGIGGRAGGSGGCGGGGLGGGERMCVCVYPRRHARTLTLHKNHHHLALDDAVDWRGEIAYLAETVMNFDTNSVMGWCMEDTVANRCQLLKGTPSEAATTQSMRLHFVSDRQW